ncbi:hypothetical protein GGS23DRAFT_98537 [Durotheca rogersii]|uniref:uncharacterized protein n=1 Tax=Durotheca rogersii TaxID=419775 RepID=UPI00221FC5AE|nr:uncharacterized protein GGS23DRAFT_98537 [Durotheca rogersii]KAI5862396.1 hypothetical protein GGS23DRAFT_98537 [Durotheca rogersii]
MSSDDGYIRDDWPKIPDGSNYDGKRLLTLVRSGNSPFKKVWDVNLLIQEVEDNINSQVIDIPFVSKGSNNYGFHFKMSDQRDILVRLARGDVNMPAYDGSPMDFLIQEIKFEAAVYTLLGSQPDIPTSRPLYYRAPVQHNGARVDMPRDIRGRCLMVFERAEGENNIWGELGPDGKACLLAQAARIRASLFNFSLPADFATAWLRLRIFEFMPEELPLPIAPTREFWIAIFTSKIKATIGEEGDMIGWEDDHNIVGPVALKAKQSLLRFVPHMMPTGNDEGSLYRLVLDHGDFGIHNMSIMVDITSQPCVTSLYDWETGCIIPAILSDPEMAVRVDLVTDENGAPSITRVPKDATPELRDEYMVCASQYIKVLYEHAPYFERAIQAGKDARHLWFALKRWRGNDPEEFFGKLGAWAESRMKEIGVE